MVKYGDTLNTPWGKTHFGEGNYDARARDMGVLFPGEEGGPSFEDVAQRTGVNIDLLRESARTGIGITQRDIQSNILKPGVTKTGLPIKEWETWQPGQPMDLFSPTGKKRSVIPGTPQANELLSNGWNVKSQIDNSFITNSTLKKEPEIRLGDIKYKSGVDLADQTIAEMEIDTQSIKDLIAQYSEILKPPESDLSKRVTQLLGEAEQAAGALTGKGAMTREMEEKYGLQQKQRALTNGVNRLQSAIAGIKSLKVSLDQKNQLEESKPQTMARLKGAQDQNYNEYVIQKNQATARAGYIQAEIKALQGNLRLAQDAVDRAVELEFMDREMNYKAKLNQLNILMPQLEKEEKRYANAVSLALQREADIIEELKTEKKNIQNAKIDAINSGITDPNILSAIGNARTYDEALQLLGTNLPITYKKPETKTIGGSLYQWNTQTGGWELAIQKPQEPEKPETRTIGGDLYQWSPQRQTWELAIQKREDLTSAMREYNAAVGQGYTGSFAEWQGKIKKDEGLTTSMREYNAAVDQGYEGSFAEWKGKKNISDYFYSNTQLAGNLNENAINTLYQYYFDRNAQASELKNWKGTSVKGLEDFLKGEQIKYGYVSNAQRREGEGLDAPKTTIFNGQVHQWNPKTGKWEVLGSAYKYGSSGTGGGKTTNNEINDWNNAQKFISDNPQASDGEIEIGLRKYTKLKDNDIKVLIENRPQVDDGSTISAPRKISWWDKITNWIKSF